MPPKVHHHLVPAHFLSLLRLCAVILHPNLRSVHTITQSLWLIPTTTTTEMGAICTSRSHDTGSVHVCSESYADSLQVPVRAVTQPISSALLMPMPSCAGCRADDGHNS
ncbi:hypothetical protein BD413DRAFT_573171 [Trametes elegans]|nr:hypothetical protein BD413DRAFT_573171 [Trametes elegans]